MNQPSDKYPCRGEAHGRAKLTALQVLEMRRQLAHGATLMRLSIEFGVDTKTVWKIKHRKLWSHV